MTDTHTDSDCYAKTPPLVSRRRFVQAVGASAAIVSATPLTPLAWGGEQKKTLKSESLVTKLYGTLTPKQKKLIHFDWNHKKDGIPYRLHVRNNWQITKQRIASGFYTKEQQDIIEAIFWGMYNPEWHDRIKKQLRDDAGGYGRSQSIALFGEPGSGKFEFVMTGRHLTIRCDGDSTAHTAFGGPIFYGHAAKGFNEKPEHPGNVFWPQAVKANELYQMLDGKQRKAALVKNSPTEQDVHFRKNGAGYEGIPVAELTRDQKEHAQKVLQMLVEPYRAPDRKEALKCLKAQGGLDKCSIAFYRSDDVGDDGVWDTWRLEGPAFVWHFRGDPHVHVWVNVADDPSVKISTIDPA